METNETLNNEKQEKRHNMDGFSLSADMLEKVEALAQTMTDETVKQAIMIPDADGQVLVKAETVACNERAADMSIIMIPALLKDGLFFVCSK